MTDLRVDSGSPIVVVLGGGMFSDAKGEPSTTARARKAVKLAKANPGWTFILSGDGRVHSAQSPLTEAQFMFRILVQNGVDRSRLLLEEEARCTVGNAVLVAARYLRHWQPRTLYVVTSPFHATRAQLLFSGVLGAQWDVQVAVSSPARGEAARRANEPGGIEWTKRFLAGIAPGDLSACITKLVAQRQHYANCCWLHLDDDPGGGGTTSDAAA